MISIVLAAAVLVGALFVAAALDDTTTDAPPGVVASRVQAAGLLAAYHTVSVTLSDRRREPVTSKAGQSPRVSQS
jgi:hypothetical protein